MVFLFGLIATGNRDTFLVLSSQFGDRWGECGTVDDDLLVRSGWHGRVLLHCENQYLWRDGIHSQIF